MTSEPFRDYPSSVTASTLITRLTTWDSCIEESLKGEHKTKPKDMANNWVADMTEILAYDSYTYDDSYDGIDLATDLSHPNPITEAWLKPRISRWIQHIQDSYITGTTKNVLCNLARDLDLIIAIGA